MSATMLADLPQAICDELMTLMPDLKECKPMAGRFSLEELKRVGLPSPAVLVSILGAIQGVTYAGPATSFMLQMAAYVVTRDGLGAPRDLHAANICQLLLSWLPGRRWLCDAMGEARDVSLHTLVSGKTRDQAVSLWAVTWNQPISFFQPAGQPLGAELYVAQSPGVGADHAADYHRIGGQG